MDQTSLEECDQALGVLQREAGRAHRRFASTEETGAGVGARRV